MRKTIIEPTTIPQMVRSRAVAMADILGLPLRVYQEEGFDYLAVPVVAWVDDKDGIRGDRWTLALDTSGRWTVGDTARWDKFEVASFDRLAEALEAVQQARLEAAAQRRLRINCQEAC